MQQQDTSEVLVDTRNGVAHITLNRPKALNALSLAMLREMDSLLQRFGDDEQVKALVLRGAGDRAFCAGGDIKAMYESVKSGAPIYHEFFCAEYPVNYALANYQKPIIALMDRIVMGGGMGISQPCRYRVITERTKMAMPETGIGLIPDVGGSFFLSRLPGAIGDYLALSGITIGPADAMYAGLADVFIPSDQLSRLDSALDSVKWSADPFVDVSALLEQFHTMPTETPKLSTLRQAIDEHFTKRTVAEIMQSLRGETRPAFTAWAQETAAILEKRSPISLAVVHEQIQRGRDMTLGECLQMELDLCTGCFEFGDIMEGIRAVVVDKDHAPKWNPPTLAQVDAKQVARFFDRTWPDSKHPLVHLR